MSDSPAAPARPERDRPWVMRTYAGHSSAAASNALYRRNLDKGQTGLSVAFDLPTQTGYDPDHVLARGEVGKVGVPISHIGDMRALFDQIPLAQMNTSMTINATAMWLLAPVSGHRRGAGRRHRGPRRDDTERHHQGVPLARNLRLRARPLDAADDRHDRLHGERDPEVEPASTSAVPPPGGRRHAGPGDRLRDVDGDRGARRGARLGPGAAERFAEVVARISFFVNAGVRFVEEMCKMRAFVQLWDELRRSAMA
jgi:(2R)-ethylmalonyl-CoA mutase